MATVNCRALPPLRPDQIEKFWSKVRKAGPDECWLWTASGYMNGYGKMNLSFGDWFMTTGAHRISYAIHFGSIPKNRYVLHKCDVRRCVNPNHFFIGDALDNARDKIKKGRDNSGTVNGMARKDVSENDIYFMREMYASGRWSMDEIGKIFYKNKNTARKAIIGISWKHVPMPIGMPVGPFSRSSKPENRAKPIHVVTVT